MKNNRQNRKREFIRHKNNLRLGITKFYCSEKVSNSFAEDEAYTRYLVETAVKSLQAKFKLRLRRCDLSFRNQDGDDFIKALHTNLVILSNT